MKLGFIGLGRMGKAMVLRLLEQGVSVVVYNRSREKTDSLNEEIIKGHFERSEKSSASRALSVNSALPSVARSLAKARDDTRITGKLTPTYNLSDLVINLDPPRVIWLMVPHGPPVDEMIKKLTDTNPEVSRDIHLRGELDRTPLVKLAKGDIIIDGGNSFYRDSIRRYEFLKKKGINYLDVGTSGGLEGARNGACMMVGGDEDIFKKVESILKLAAIPGGVAYFGPTGAGHFVKMVHNGVEYGMLQAIGEGFEMLAKGHYRLDLHKVASNWMHGSVVRGWLMELLEKALKADPRLENIEGVVGGGSTGEWTIATAKELKVATPVIEKSLEARKKSLEKPTFSGKVVAALRYQFGGHSTKKSDSVEKV